MRDFWEIFGINFGRPSLWWPLAMAALRYSGPKAHQVEALPSVPYFNCKNKARTFHLNFCCFL